MYIFPSYYTICATGPKLKQNPEMPRKCRLYQLDAAEIWHCQQFDWFKTNFQASYWSKLSCHWLLACFRNCFNLLTCILNCPGGKSLISASSSPDSGMWGTDWFQSCYQDQAVDIDKDDDDGHEVIVLEHVLWCMMLLAVIQSASQPTLFMFSFGYNILQLPAQANQPNIGLQGVQFQGTGQLCLDLVILSIIIQSKGGFNKNCTAKYTACFYEGNYSVKLNSWKTAKVDTFIL